jgi:hypothetical protein
MGGVTKLPIGPNREIPASALARTVTFTTGSLPRLFQMIGDLIDPKALKILF